jgi:hypothetical protein
LLTIPSVQFPTAISWQDRLRVAYLTHFLQQQPQHTFYLIDQVMDSSFSLNGMDYYFYMASAYLIGEPVEELAYFMEDVTLPPDDPFYDDFNALRNNLATAKQHDERHDPYLLKVASLDFAPSEATLAKVDTHPWVQSAENASIVYKIPVPVETLLDLMLAKLIDVAITTNMWQDWGIGVALTLSQNAIKASFHKHRKNIEEAIFEQLIGQLQ